MMKTILSVKKRNRVLKSMIHKLDTSRSLLLEANDSDMKAYKGEDPAMKERLQMSHAMIDGMIASVQSLADQKDPLGKKRFHFTHENGLEITNRTAPFGTVMIIYESRPDVTVEAAGIAFKSGNKILLKGGKESLHSNKAIVSLWKDSLKDHNIDTSWVTYLEMDRKETQDFLRTPSEPLDLIVPRGGERLIEFVKEHARCPVIVSGRGNNFAFVDREADKSMAMKVILNAKTHKISACNALDKVLIDSSMEGAEGFAAALAQEFQRAGVKVFTGSRLGVLDGSHPIPSESIWGEEFLEKKVVLELCENTDEAISFINTWSGGHSATILTHNKKKAERFMQNVDCAAVYHNASTRFTDGGQLGLGGELAISTDKLHQRGPIGLEHLVTNKWYIQGSGQIRH